MKGAYLNYFPECQVFVVETIEIMLNKFWYRSLQVGRVKMCSILSKNTFKQTLSQGLNLSEPRPAVGCTEMVHSTSCPQILLTPTGVTHTHTPLHMCGELPCPCRVYKRRLKTPGRSSSSSRPTPTSSSFSSQLQLRCLQHSVTLQTQRLTGE